MIKFIRKYAKERNIEKHILRISGTLLILISMLIVSVSAFIIEQPSNTMAITFNQGILGNIEEGQTILYTSSNTSSLKDIISITTAKANVCLHFDTDLDDQSNNYLTYQIVVKVCDTGSKGSRIATGDIVATLTIVNPDTISGVVLDVAGCWVFDFEITTTAKSVISNQESTVNITVSAESTST